ncbi:MAG: MaoC family dehydratase [Actinomycetota bacterium]
MKLEVGQELASKEYLLTRDSLVRYAGASGDFNPIHYRDDVALAVGLPGVLAHGMLTMGVAVQVVAEFIGDSGKISDYQVRFTKPVVVDAESGARLTVSGKVAEIDEANSVARIDITASFQETIVLGKAQVRVRLS